MRINDGRKVNLPDKQKAISRGEVAVILGCSERHVSNLMNSGDLERFDIACEGAKRPRWFTSKESVESFLRIRREQGKQDDGFRGEVLEIVNRNEE